MTAITPSLAAPLLAASLLLPLGCKAPAVAEPDWPRQEIGQAGEEVSILLDPYLDQDRVEQAFGDSCVDAGVLPVRLAIKNRSGSSLLLDMARVSLVGAHHDETPSARQETPEFRPGLPTILWFGPTGLLMMRGAARNETRQLNARLSRSALRSQTLAPGDEAAGFVYFALDPKAESAAGTGDQLRLELLHPGDPSPMVISAPIEAAQHGIERP